MLNIGLIDLDTSHALSFAQLLSSREGLRVAGVCDGGQVRSSEQVDRFCEQFACGRYERVETLATAVDVAMVLSADWQVHLDRLEPLLRAGVPTYVDKPIAGSVAGLDRFLALARETGTPVLTGSGWRYNATVDAARARWADVEIDTVHAIVGNDFFYYGIHVVEAILGFLGPGLETVQLVSEAEAGQVITFTHRRSRGRLLLGGSTFFRGIAFESGGGGHAVTFTGKAIHQGVCDALLAMHQHGRAPLPPEQQIESVQALLAARQSLQSERPVALTELDPQANWPSEAFMARYVQQSRPESLVGSSA